MKNCCLDESSRSLKRHRDVATCDSCGALLLAYGRERDFEATLAELRRRGARFETIERGNLKIVAKAR
ncbi:MAG TPA: hypothetical protein VEK15_24445, partial [Vicinamibacteria bacterium]|nr:hypothetical protein [Vicinamibacteria bacterium]